MAAQTSIDGVLLVEDNPGDAKLIEHHFESTNFPGLSSDSETTHVERLDAGIEELERNDYDVVFLDLGLPESSGIETLDRMMDAEPGVPVIVLTGLDDHERAINAIQRGAQDYLVKGEITGETLARSLRYAIERRKQMRALERQKEQMEFFNAILRHDMLNALTIILERGRTLEDRLEGENREYAESILANGNKIMDVTDRVRSVLDTLTSEEDLELATIDIAQVVASEVERVRTAETDASIETSLPEEAPVHADELVADVISNVLTNAVEHNDTDEPEMSVTVDDPPDERHVRVRVADNGPGIPDSEKDRVLGRGETGTHSGGTGFGMYFANSMIEAYDGSIRIEDNDPRGTVVVIRIPAA